MLIIMVAKAKRRPVSTFDTNRAKIVRKQGEIQAVTNEKSETANGIHRKLNK
jgi:hypothetical protein